jgi:Cupin domain
MRITIPPHFAGPIPHAHDGFDEAICVLSGRLLVLGDGEPQEAPPGSMFVAPRGHRHGFRNPSGEMAPRCWACGPRQSPPWPSCATLAPRSALTSRQTRTGCARSTPGTPAACCPDTRQLPRAHISADTRQRHLRGMSVCYACCKNVDQSTDSADSIITYANLNGF